MNEVECISLGGTLSMASAGKRWICVDNGLISIIAVVLAMAAFLRIVVHSQVKNGYVAFFLNCKVNKCTCLPI